MKPYLSLTEAADRLNISPEWFIANVAPHLPSPIELNGELSWLTAAIDDWKARCDAARDVALDELAAIDQEILQVALQNLGNIFAHPKIDRISGDLRFNGFIHVSKYL